MIDVNEDKLSEMLYQAKFKLNKFGHQVDDPNSRCDTRVLSEYEIIYNIGGTTLVVIDNQSFSLHAGDLLLIPKFTVHKIETPYDDRHNNYWAHFDIPLQSLANNLMQAFYLAWGGYCFNIGLDEDLIGLYIKLEDEASSQNDGNNFMRNLIFGQILTTIIRKTNVVQSLNLDNLSLNPIFIQAYEFLKGNYRDIHKVEQIAEKVHISSSYCSKLFAQYLNCSPAKMIMELKMKEAEILLKFTKQSIKEIGEDLGFSSSYHFSNTFKQYYKISPNKYRMSNFNC